jgi:CHAD domain-containing protein
MAGRLRRNESGTHGTRRLARREIRDALQALERRPLTDEAVHEARKALKRARAMLRLLRKGLGDETYRRENMALRDAARPLSEVRDGKVLLDAFEQLLAHCRDGPPPEATAGLHRALVARRNALRRARLAGRRPLEPQRQALRAAQRRARRFSTGKRGWSVLGTGLERVYRKGREALARARTERTPACLHEWRKRTKYLWHALQALEPSRPATIGALARKAHQLADELGDHHDLTVLAGTLIELADSTDSAVVEALLPLIDRRRGELEREAFRVGTILYREPPAALARRFARYWREWRAEVPRATSSASWAAASLRSSSAGRGRW